MKVVYQAKLMQILFKNRISYTNLLYRYWLQNLFQGFWRPVIQGCWRYQNWTGWDPCSYILGVPKKFNLP